MKMFFCEILVELNVFLVALYSSISLALETSAFIFVMNGCGEYRIDSFCWICRMEE